VSDIDLDIGAVDTDTIIANLGLPTYLQPLPWRPPPNLLPMPSPARQPWRQGKRWRLGWDDGCQPPEFVI
jgi:hypothetical protein